MVVPTSAAFSSLSSTRGRPRFGLDTPSSVLAGGFLRGIFFCRFCPCVDCIALLVAARSSPLYKYTNLVTRVQLIEAGSL